MNDIAVLGSGFGLYGYLPSIDSSSLRRIYLPNRYKDKVLSRPELKNIKEKVIWVDNEDDAISMADLVIIALNPNNQERWVKACLNLDNINSLILEKPLAVNPGRAKILLSDLMNSKKNFEIGYLFRHTDWGYELIDFFNDSILVSHINRIEITWNFLAHHFFSNLDTWKRYHSDGGGVLRFFGIHLIALLSELGYTNVSMSRLYGKYMNQPSRWEATFISPSLPECQVIIDSFSESESFSINASKNNTIETLQDLRHPFETEFLNKKFKPEARLSPLKKLIKSLGDGMSEKKK